MSAARARQVRDWCRNILPFLKETFVVAAARKVDVAVYPSQWERKLILRDGSHISVRPIRQGDESKIHGLLQHVSKRDLRLRFFGTIKVFTDEFVARLTHLDYARAMAFIAFDEVDTDIHGVVRLHMDSVCETGEYAILIKTALKGRGLGWALMQLILEYARFKELKFISGQVLIENYLMLDMCRELGFQITSNDADCGIYDVKLEL